MRLCVCAGKPQKIQLAMLARDVCPRMPQLLMQSMSKGWLPEQTYQEGGHAHCEHKVVLICRRAAWSTVAHKGTHSK